MTRKPPAQQRGSPAGTAAELKRGQWTPEEDELLAQFVAREGEGRWRTLPRRAGLQRCGKSCRLRWMNYLRPSIKRGPICPDEEDLILRLHRLLGNRWSLIAGRLPGRTDNEIKNYWNTHLSKKLVGQGIDPRTHRPLADASHDAGAATKKAVAQPPVHQSSPAAGDHHDHEPNGGDGFAGVISLEYGGDVWCDDVGGADGFGGQFWRSEAAAGGGGGDVITMDDGAFSSFLESLINDDCIHAGEGDGDQEKCGENDRVGTDAVSGRSTLSLERNV